MAVSRAQDGPRASRRLQIDHLDPKWPLERLIARHDLHTLRRLHAYLIRDSCDDDARIRELALPILGSEWLDGSSYYVPGNICIVEALVERIGPSEIYEL